MTSKRTVFFVSDRTGITAELLGRTVLSQFQGVEFRKVTLPFIDTIEKANAACEEIAKAHADGARPLVISTLIEPDIRSTIAGCGEFFIDLFDMFIAPLEAELGVPSSHVSGLSHGIANHGAYDSRIEAVNFALSHDDGVTTVGLDTADIILIGVSRSGKTPTCLYLALQFGIRAANYPLTPDDFAEDGLPRALLPHWKKLFGLTISPERLHQIRSERKVGSAYASLENCRKEIGLAQGLFRSERIPHLDTTTMSVEEIAITVLHASGLLKGR